MRSFIPLLFTSFCVACSVAGQVTTQEQTTIEVRTNTVYVPDTVFIEIPRIVERVQTLDTISVIDTKYAVSEAQVSNGVLAHSLEIKPVREPTIVQKEIVYKDSIIVKQVDVDHYIEVPADPTRPRLKPFSNVFTRPGSLSPTLRFSRGTPLLSQLRPSPFSVPRLRSPEVTSL